MRPLRCFRLLLAIGLLPVAASGFPLNNKRAPETEADLLMIQDALNEAIPGAMAATVCVDLGNGTGSGVIVSEDGLVMTAAHVSTGVGKLVTIIMPDGTRLEAITLGLVADVDAALIQITEKLPNDEEFPVVEINRKNDTKLADWVFSLGHSGGFNKERGAVARVGRLVRIADSTYQTDGNLIGGDSGGPLFDMDGRLIGIHSRVGRRLPENMHVPVRVFLENWEGMLASEFIGEGPFAAKPEKGKGFLGIVTKAAEGGIMVTKVGKNSPAEAAGIREDDLLVSLNGEELESREVLQGILAELTAGNLLVFEVKRDGNNEKIEVRLGSR